MHEKYLSIFAEYEASIEAVMENRTNLELFAVYKIVSKDAERIYVNIVHVRGVLGNKCAGPHNLKTVQIRDIVSESNIRRMPFCT
jgi:hypothetical protein